MQKSDLIAFRNFMKEDEGFIFTTWIQGYQGGHQWLRKVPRKIFWERYKAIIEALLKVRDVKVACLKSDPQVIIGYSVFSEDSLDWVYVKESWRKIGVARDLVPASLKSVTHMTNVGYQILKQYPKIIYNPFL